MASTSNNSSPMYDRLKELEAFNNTKLGVKGLVDSGITQVPRIFHHSPETLFDLEESDDQNLIPVIDLTGPNWQVVEKIREASSTFGFFQIINHGIPATLADSLITSMKGFHEMAPDEKRKWYDNSLIRDKEVLYYSNFDLFKSKAASWRDTLQIRPSGCPDALPPVYKNEVMEWDCEMKRLASQILGLLSEGLGLSNDKLEGMFSLERICMFANYYPYCPEPTKTIGIASHTDPGVMTILVQDEIGGLQLKFNGKWVNLKPVPGALVVNIGDLLQIISNDGYKSGEHRVVANSSRNARLSVAVTFSQGIGSYAYGPLPELVTDKNPTLYKNFIFSDFLKTFFTNELDGKTMPNHYRM